MNKSGTLSIDELANRVSQLEELILAIAPCIPQTCPYDDGRLGMGGVEHSCSKCSKHKKIASLVAAVEFEVKQRNSTTT